MDGYKVASISLLVALLIGGLFVTTYHPQKPFPKLMFLGVMCTNNGGTAIMQRDGTLLDTNINPTDSLGLMQQSLGERS